MGSFRAHRLLLGAALAASFLWHRTASAGDELVVFKGDVDPPTVISLGVAIQISGDDNRDATAAVRYRVKGTDAWHDGLPLHRVRPSVVVGFPVTDGFAGSLFWLSPATAYEIEVHLTDPDGGDTTVPLEATTRAVPASDPVGPNEVKVTNAAELTAALANAAPGDVIELANGTYAGNFSLDASGLDDFPIVIRGASQDGVILDGQGCDPCNVLEVYGSFVHVERLTIAHASRGLRFQGTGAESNVVRRVKMTDVTLGIGSKSGQRDFYLCDNDLTGRLVWPQVYTDDGGAHANDDGIHVEGLGHVICHNRLLGFGDAMKVEQDGAVSVDFYGNEVLSAYDNGVELDGSARNTRCFSNRFTNTYATMSFQPIFGGPVYAIRNVVVNVDNEQLKFHALGGNPPKEPSGMIVLHNTFVSPARALNLQDDATSHDFLVENNLFIGPESPENGRTVDWTGFIDNGLFDHNGYFPDGEFAYNFAGSGVVKVGSFAALQAAGVEKNGLLLPTGTFESGLAPPATYTVDVAPADATLAAGSPAVDGALLLPGINDGFKGAGPDLGALERGCPIPVYGVRPEGVDETSEVFGCPPGAGGTGGGGAGGAGGAGGDVGGGVATESGHGASGGGGASGGTGGGCGCGLAGEDRGAAGSALAAFWILLLGAARRRRQRASKPDRSRTARPAGEHRLRPQRRRSLRGPSRGAELTAIRGTSSRSRRPSRTVP